MTIRIRFICTMLLFVAAESFSLVQHSRTIHNLHTRPSSLGSIVPACTRSKLYAEAKEVASDINIIPDSKRRLSELSEMVQSNLSGDVVNYSGLMASVEALESASTAPDFWDDQQKAQSTLSEMNRLKALIKRVDGWKRSCEDTEALLEIATEDPNETGTLPATIDVVGTDYSINCRILTGGTFIAAIALL